MNKRYEEQDFGKEKENTKKQTYVNWDEVEVKDGLENLTESVLESPKECVDLFFDHFYNVPEEPTEEQMEEIMEQQEKRKAYEEKRLEANKEIRDILISRFDELFTEHIKYDKKRDKSYYRYVFKYGHVWSDGDHLVINNDVRDKFEEYELERSKEDIVLSL